MDDPRPDNWEAEMAKYKAWEALSWSHMCEDCSGRRYIWVETNVECGSFEADELVDGKNYIRGALGRVLMSKECSTCNGSGMKNHLNLEEAWLKYQYPHLY
jgi:DnaJ-class molecular chaperone